ncbi:MAG: hypoxanthine phosphoribosyltransferase [Acetivibrionales bacterium]|jgi:hypoxanthine phosphoribosyltransferase|nr:hypoxanthine phosphoribosyltransferase [Clostridiaceae bacterium]
MNLTKIKKIIFSEKQIRDRVKELGQQISADYKDKHPILISVLKGTLYFMADLTRAIDIQVNIDFMSIGVYPGVSRNTGIVKINKDLDLNITGRHVLFVEDIINTGLTMGYLVQNMESRKPASIKICTLLNNPQKRLMNIPLEYVGFEVPDTYLVGYGLDHNQEYRHLPYIGEFEAKP